jgi:hypothetical protein
VVALGHLVISRQHGARVGPNLFLLEVGAEPWIKRASRRIEEIAMKQITTPDDNAVTESIAVAHTVTALTSSLIEIRDRLARARSLHGSLAKARSRHGGWDNKSPPLTADQQTAIVAKLGELQAQFTDDDTKLVRALETWAPANQITSLVGVMALGYPVRNGASSGYAGVLLAALVAEDLEDSGTIGFTRAEPISAPVIALAITRICQVDNKFLPSPSEFRHECLEARKRVSFLLRNVRDMLSQPIPSPPLLTQVRSQPALIPSAPTTTAAL